MAAMSLPASPSERNESAAATPLRLVGRQDTQPFGDQSREELRWVGKPWRRIELMTNRCFWKGEQVDTTRDLSFHIGFRRLGLGFTFSVVKASVLDYADEPNV